MKPQVKPQVKCCWSLPAGQTSEDEARARRALDLTHSPQVPRQPGKGHPRRKRTHNQRIPPYIETTTQMPRRPPAPRPPHDAIKKIWNLVSAKPMHRG